MLKSLYIKNYALIDSLEIDFEQGFSVITGETGAGKSIILGALGLIVGQRADAKTIKMGESKCVIEGIFNISAYDLKAFFTEREIDYDEICILRRELMSSGKSRAFINDTPVTLADLKELGNRLIDIHSQHQNLMLGDNQFQMHVVDALAGNANLLKEYNQIYTIYKDSEKKLKNLQDAITKSRQEEEYLRFQYTALDEAALKEGEQEELEAELEMLNHAEDIKSGLYKINILLSDDERGIVAALKESLSVTHSLSKMYNRSEEMQQRLDTAYIDLKDLSSEVERMAGDIEFNPERLAFVEERLNKIYSLQKKYNIDTVAGLLALKYEINKKLENIDSFDQQLKEQQQEVADNKEKVDLLASKLSSKRKSAIKPMEETLTKKTSVLGMPNIRFECNISPKQEADITGIDNLEFLFSSNKNVPLQPVSEIASGGEISRLMLCLKSMIAGATALPTIIFDEIDTGVSGEIADKMGQIMQEFGQSMQVIAITHLPQIAAKGRAHYLVYKTDDEKTTTTNLRKLSDKERLEEIARMLSGASLTDAAIQNARVMLGLK